MENTLNYISKYRNSLMGIAIIWIIFGHSHISINIPQIIRFPFCGLGYGGVEIFLFLSGLGIYCSLYKDNDLGNFYLRRIKRFLPAIPIFIIYIFIIKLTIFHQIVGIFTLENFWLDNRAFGYLSYAFLCYTLSPILVDIINKHLHSISNKILFLLFILLLSIPFWGDGRIQGIARVPIFFIGLCVGQYFKKQVQLNKKSFLFTIFLSAIGFICLIITYTIFYKIRFKYGLMYYSMLLFIPGLIFLLVNTVNLINKMTIGKYLVKILNFIGGGSLEIFLIESLVVMFLKEKLLFYEHLFLSLSIGILYYYLFYYIKIYITKLIKGFRNVCKIK